MGVGVGGGVGVGMSLRNSAASCVNTNLSGAWDGGGWVGEGAEVFCMSGALFN